MSLVCGCAIALPQRATIALTAEKTPARPMRLVKHCLVIMALLLMHAGGRVRTALD
jgi:hypothetical protein